MSSRAYTNEFPFRILEKSTHSREGGGGLTLTLEEFIQEDAFLRQLEMNDFIYKKRRTDK